MTKKEIQMELTKRNVKYSSKANKGVLETLLKCHMVEDIKQDISEELKTVEEFDIPVEFKGVGFALTEDEFKIDKYAASYKYRGKRKFLGHYANEKDAEDALLKISARGRIITHVNK